MSKEKDMMLLRQQNVQEKEECLAPVGSLRELEWHGKCTSFFRFDRSGGVWLSPCRRGQVSECLLESFSAV